MRPHNIVIGQAIDPIKAQRAKELRRDMTPEEGILWDHLRANRFDGHHFRRQQVIDGFIVDFYCHAVGLVVEVDGGIHQEQVAYDQERDLVLSSRGLRVLRVSNAEVNGAIAVVLQRISDACKIP